MSAGRWLLAATIVAVASAAIYAIADRRNRDLAGPAAQPLAPGPEQAAFTGLLDDLERLGQAPVAARLRELESSGRLWVAPFLQDGREAVFVSTLGLIERIYVDEEALLLSEAPFPELDLPEDWRRTYARLRLAGTLYHELSHLDGELEEANAYREEAAWYGRLADSSFFQSLEGEQERMYRWAIQSAILGAHKAAERAAADG